MTQSDERDQISCSYRSGDWYAVVGPRALVLVADRDRAAAAWPLVDAGEGFDRVLDALVRPDLSGLSDLVLVGLSGGAARVLVRGPRARAEVDGLEVLDSDEVVWTERTLPDVGSVRLGRGGEPGDETGAEPGGEPASDLALPSGLVRAARIDWTAVSAPLVSPDAPAFASSGERLTVVPDIDLPADLPADLPVDPFVPPFDDDAETGALEALLEGPDEGASAYEPETEQFPVAAPDPGEMAELTISGGERVRVDRVLLIGRAPKPGPLIDGDDPRLVSVSSPMKEVSATHIEVRPGSGSDQGLAVVTDLGSTNGTVLMQPELGAEDLTPGIATALVPGAVINLGDGVTIEVGLA